MNVPLFNELDIGKARNAQMSGLGGEAEIFRSITALLVLMKRLWSSRG